ncbi:MAG TPA: ComEC/Rec2 family competence protein, partial [Acidimicrobiales bacterium]
CRRRDEPSMTDFAAVAVAATTAVGAWWSPALPAWPGMVLAVVALVARRIVLLAVGCALAAGALAHDAWAAVEPPAPARLQGPVTLVDDPQPRGRALRAVVETSEGRLEAWARGASARRLQQRLAGEVVVVEGQMAPASPDQRRRLGARHVRGILQVSEVGPWNAGSPAARSANRVRRLLARSASALPAPQRPLYMGMVIGDDRDLDPAVVRRFRAAGLSHLMAVSGQNVALVLALAAPLIGRLPIRARWVATLTLVGWFVLVTRAEPSVLRAAAMAVLSATARLLGRPASPMRLLSLAVTALVLVDPLLVWSVGWWLSVGATTGIAALAPRIEARLRGPRWFTEPLAVTSAAQVGVLPVSLLVFGSVPSSSVPANVVAAPAAAAVTVLGLPAGLVGAWVPHPVAVAALLPARVCLFWIDTVASVAARGPAVPASVVVAVLLTVLAAAAGRHLARSGR